MSSLLLIPQDIDLPKLYQVSKTTAFKNAINNWKELYYTHYFKWQEFIFCCGTDVGLEIGNWLEDMLLMLPKKML